MRGHDRTWRGFPPTAHVTCRYTTNYVDLCIVYVFSKTAQTYEGRLKSSVGVGFASGILTRDFFSCDGTHMLRFGCVHESCYRFCVESSHQLVDLANHRVFLSVSFNGISIFQTQRIVASTGRPAVGRPTLNPPAIPFTLKVSFLSLQSVVSNVSGVNEK